MRRNVLIIAGLISIFSFLSCETDFDVTAEWEDITIVYGLLSQNDSVHQIKVNKAFLGDGNLIEYAGIQDSSTYDNDITVKLQELDDNGVRREFELDTTVIHNKEEGVFYHPDQVIYTTGKDNKVFLDDDYTYRVEIYIPSRDKTVWATTELVNDFDIHKPRLNSLTQPTIHFPNNESTREILWSTAENGRRYQLKIYFHIREHLAGGETRNRTLTWETFDVQRSKDIDGGNSMMITFPNNRFYEFATENVPYEDEEKESQVNIRDAQSLVFEISVASDIFDTYMEIYEPSTSIIQYRPEFTNIENGMGLFASRYVKTRKLYLFRNTKEYLNELEIKFRQPAK